MIEKFLNRTKQITLADLATGHGKDCLFARE